MAPLISLTLHTTAVVTFGGEEVIAMASGSLYGLLLGSSISWLGWYGGSWIQFWLARRACYVLSGPGHALALSTLYAIGVTAGLAWLYRTGALSAFSAFVVFGVAGFVVSLPAMGKALIQKR